jgi:anthranilate phosphoribosyltransferase
MAQMALKDGKITEYVLNPKQFGMSIHQLKEIQIQNAEESKAMILDVLAGKQGPARDIVLLNAGAAIYVAGLQPNIHAGIEHAAKIIDSGLAAQKLQQLVLQSQQAK